MSSPKVVTLAFYSGWGGSVGDRLIDLAVRVATLSRFSHVEVLPGGAKIGRPHNAISSSPRDGGVREKRIQFDQKKWVFVEVPAERLSLAAFSCNQGAKYDYFGAMASPLRLPVPIFGRGRFFCSELAALIIDCPDPWAWSPGRLFRWARGRSE